MFLFSRAANSNHRREPWTTNVRVLDNITQTLGTPQYFTSSMGHNLGALCIDPAESHVALVGGQYRPERDEPHWQGVRIALVNSLFALPAAKTTFIRADSCVEGRIGYADSTKTECEFDGKFSLYKPTTDALTHLFARANLAMGLRWVQTTSSPNLRDWSPYELISMKGVDKYKASIYFLHVESWNQTHALGLFPGVLYLNFTSRISKDAGIYATFSSNMVNWSHPTLLVRQEADDGRVARHPIGLLDGRLLTYDRHIAPFEDGLMISTNRLDKGEGHVAVDALECWAPARRCYSARCGRQHFGRCHTNIAGDSPQDASATPSKHPKALKLNPKWHSAGVGPKDKRAPKVKVNLTSLSYDPEYHGRTKVHSPLRRPLEPAGRDARVHASGGA